jgi:aryl-alcohol dehydrogenase-like predicted oxidoreductase
MQYRKLGNSGLKLSELSFGSWVTFNKQVDSKLAEEMFGTCLDAGVNFLITLRVTKEGCLRSLWAKL